MALPSFPQSSLTTVTTSSDGGTDKARLGSDKNRFPIATIRKTTKILAGDFRFLVFVLLSQNVETAKICHKNKIT